VNKGAAQVAKRLFKIKALPSNAGSAFFVVLGVLDGKAAKGV
jgi:hypothetical protein